jgi:hypothetical protein
MSKKKFESVKKLYEAAIESQTYRDYMSRAQLCYDYRDSKQWTQQEIDELHERGQVPVVINKITNRIKGLSGTEIVGRTRIGYAPRSMNMDNEATAEALTHIALFIQDKNNAVFHRSKVFEDSLVTGIGAYLTEKDDQAVLSRRVDPRDVFWDMSDTSFDLYESAYRGFRGWFNIEDLVATYPSKAENLQNMVGMTDKSEFAVATSFTMQASSGQDYIDESGRVNYVDKSKGRVLVVELEYRQKEQAYEYVDNEGRLIRTFDVDEAKKHRINKEEARQKGFYGIVYRELLAYRYYTCQFAGDVELHHAPSEINLKPDFDLQFLVLDKTETDNVPAGLVFWAIDAQKELNKRRSKMLHHLNSVRVIADSDAFENPELIRKEAARPDAMITKKKGTEVKIEYTTDLAKGQFDIMTLADKEIQDQLGIYDDMLGRETNATSGVAIQKRQNSSMRQQAPQFDKFKLFMKKHGELLLVYIQNVFRDEQVMTIMDDDGLAKAIQINAPLRDKEGQIVSKDGKPVMVNDVRAGTFDVYVKETLDVASFNEDTLERLSQMLMNGVQPSALTLMAAGFTERQAAELMKKAAPPQQQGQVLPSPATPAAGQAPTPQGV